MLELLNKIITSAKNALIGFFNAITNFFNGLFSKEEKKETKIESDKYTANAKQYTDSEEYTKASESKDSVTLPEFGKLNKIEMLIVLCKQLKKGKTKETFVPFSIKDRTLVCEDNCTLLQTMVKAFNSADSVQGSDVKLIDKVTVSFINSGFDLNLDDDGKVKSSLSNEIEGLLYGV